MPEYIPPVQIFDDGSSITTFDDGSTLVTNSEGGVSSTPSTDSMSSAAGGGESLSSFASGATGAVGTAVSGAVSSALTNLVGGALGNLLGSSALGKLLGASLKLPTPTGIIPNPLHQFASSSYALSLWWLDIDDFNRMTDPGSADIGTGMNYQLGPQSYVIAEDSGLYPDRRLPTQLGLNYNIQDITFETIVGHNSKSKSSNMISGSMTVVEPFGVTFLDSLVRASGMGGTYKNYTSQPYMLQIDFTGYDDAGDPVPSGQTGVYRKRFPIQITGMKIEVTGKGAEYKIEYVPMGHIAYTPEHSTTPKDITINTDTVGGFFTAFENALNAFWKLEALDKKTQYADSIKFNIDPAIAKCSIVYDKQTSITSAAPNTKSDKAKIDLSKGNFNIPAGTQIQEVIGRVVQQSNYITGQLKLDNQNDKVSDVQQSETQILNTFKTTSQVSYVGVSGSGAEVKSAFDNSRNTFAKRFTYNVSQYHNYDVKHPAAPSMTDSRPYTVKEYNYLYTGQNIDIIDLKINFDSTFYTAVNSYTTAKGATNATQSTALDSLISAGASLLISPQLLGSLGVIPGLGSIPNLTPNRFKNIVNDRRTNTGLNTINNPAAQTGANVLESTYTKQNQEMVSVDLTILGDPTLLKQDDWLYSPNPAANNNIFSQIISQLDVAKKYGQIKMDDGELIVGLTINTPVDIDTEWTNQGLAYPAIGSTPSLFSGVYRIISIKNNFSGGNFTQQLSLIRQSNSDALRSGVSVNAAISRELSSAIQGGLNSLNATVQNAVGSVVGKAPGLIDNAGKSLLSLASSTMGNESSATSDSSASQATFGADGSVNSEYDANRYGSG
jgi:hypothetical protein